MQLRGISIEQSDAWEDWVKAFHHLLSW
jgi:hypothetical protein